MRAFVMTAVLLLAAASFAAGPEVELLTEDYAPFQYRDDRGRLTGFGVELVTGVFEEAGVSIRGDEIRLYPWARAYQKVLTQKDSAVFMTVRTREREPLFHWVGPLAPRAMWLFKLREREDVKVATLEDAKAYRVAGYRDSADTRYLLQLGFQVETVSGQQVLTQFLIKGRTDLISSLEQTMAFRLGELGLLYDTVEKTVILDDRYDYYLAVNRETDRALVERLQAALEQLKKNGFYDALWTRYVP